MKKAKKTNQERVIIYALYDDNENYYDENDNSELLSLGCDREEELKKYCKEKQYEIKEIVRNAKSDYVPYKLKCILEVVYKYQALHCQNCNSTHKDSCYTKLEKIIIYDIYELCSNISEFNVIFDITNSEHIEIETIKQGKIHNNSFKGMEVIKNEN